MLIPDSKKRIIDAASAEVDNIESQYRDGIITVRKNNNKVVDVWTKATAGRIRGNEQGNLHGYPD